MATTSNQPAPSLWAGRTLGGWLVRSVGFGAVIALVIAAFLRFELTENFYLVAGVGLGAAALYGLIGWAMSRRLFRS
jgi:hypothetical protein